MICTFYEELFESANFKEIYMTDLQNFCFGEYDENKLRDRRPVGPEESCLYNSIR